MLNSLGGGRGRLSHRKSRGTITHPPYMMARCVMSVLQWIPVHNKLPLLLLAYVRIKGKYRASKCGLNGELAKIGEILVRLNVFNHVLTIEGVLCYFYHRYLMRRRR